MIDKSKNYYCPGIMSMCGFSPEHGDHECVNIYPTLAAAQASLADDVAEWFRQVAEGEREWDDAFSMAEECAVVVVQIGPEGMALAFDEFGNEIEVDHGWLGAPGAMHGCELGTRLYLVEPTGDPPGGPLSQEEREILKGMR